MRILKIKISENRTYTRKNAQVVTLVCKQVATNLFTSCQQVVFALLVPMLLQQVWNKLLTTSYKLDGIIRLATVQGCSNKSDKALI